MPPSPRFHRLPKERREHILAVARRHIAAEGPDRMSYNQIIEESDISRTSAYMYFDGKADLVLEVYRDLTERLFRILGPWENADSPADFWTRLRSSSERLRMHHLNNPEDAALIGWWPPDLPMPDAMEWLSAMLHNGREVGVVRSDVPPELMLAATQALNQACDQWALGMFREGRTSDEDLEPVWTLFEGLWASGMATEDRKPGKGKKKRKQKKQG